MRGHPSLGAVPPFPPPPILHAELQRVLPWFESITMKATGLSGRGLRSALNVER